jgi:hypothetical protein
MFPIVGGETSHAAAIAAWDIPDRFNFWIAFLGFIGSQHKEYFSPVKFYRLHLPKIYFIVRVVHNSRQGEKVHPILQEKTIAQPRRYRLLCIDQTIAYRGWVPDSVPASMQVFDFWAVSDDAGPQGEIGRQAVYVTTAWVQLGRPISYKANSLFIYDDEVAKDCQLSAAMLPSEVAATFTRAMSERKFRP